MLPRHDFSRRKQFVFSVLLIFVLLAVTVGVSEGITRLLGGKPWKLRKERLSHVVVEPGGRLFAPHPTLGYALRPGHYVVKLSRVTWYATHLDMIHRLTRPTNGTPPPEPHRNVVWIFGDSMTYGWGLNDNDTYPWLLQQKHPELEVVNFAVGGYSTLQSLIELKETLAAGVPPPRLAIVAYASFHDGRNALLRGNRKAWIPDVERYPVFPKAWLDAQGKLRYELVQLQYRPWPIESHSALINFLSNGYNKLQVLTSRASRVSQAIIREFHRVCQEHGIDFVLVGIYDNARTAAMLAWASQQGIRTLDIAVDLSIPENIIPGDGHPSARANIEFAQRLEAALPVSER